MRCDAPTLALPVVQPACLVCWLVPALSGCGGAMAMTKHNGPYPRPLSERFEEKYIPEPNTGCWLWTGALGGGGYGAIGAGGKRGGRRTAHRVAYELYRGPIPAGLELDHLCRTRCCVNPWHLEPVTRRENVLRGVSAAAQQAKQTHCKWGHEFTPENTYRETPTKRGCKECRRRLTREAGQRRRRRARQAR